VLGASWSCVGLSLVCLHTIHPTRTCEEIGGEGIRANSATDLLIIGTGPHTIPIAPKVREYLNGLGMRLEIQDTRNAAAQFNLLATERGVGQVAAALIPIGWREGR
jgi:uncharacterized protein